VAGRSETGERGVIARSPGHPVDRGPLAQYHARPMTAPRRLSLGLLLLALAPLPGCLGYRTGRPERIASQSIHPRGRLDRPAAVEWRQVLIGTPPHATVRGYVRSDEVPLEGSRETATTHLVYDRDFRLVGRCSPVGQTYRIDVAGGEHPQGNLPLDVACLLLLEADKTDEVHLAAMPAPRS
jgi:hypothetical protein